MGDGNNGDLVRRVLRKRYWWREVTEVSSKLNLLWQATSKGIIFDRFQANKTPKQVVNHFEFHREISTKIGLIKNLQLYCEFNQIQVFDLTPVTFVIDTEDKNFEYDIQEFVRFFQAHDAQLLPQQFQNQMLKTYGHPQSKDIQITTTNNFTNTQQLNFSSPLSFSMKSPVNKLNSYANLSYRPYYAFSKPKMYDTFIKGSNLWLMKPTDLNRGRGITLFNSLRRFKQQLQSTDQPVTSTFNFNSNCIMVASSNGLSPSNDPTNSKVINKQNDHNKNAACAHNFKLPSCIRTQKFVLQKYVESPMLINKRKFDIRVWILLDHEMNLYFFKEGYLRLSSELFTLDETTIENKFVHLTNNAVQKYSNQYGKFENGNQLLFANFEVNF